VMYGYLEAQLSPHVIKILLIPFSHFEFAVP
jgi:hypothetical protein